ncbi:dihydrolipoyl dehydrogenase [Rhizobium sp. KVB221]|uniref:Dihydrolipoyl dehydrogenase n=1 Tax=Rhizobium setariae TaxID=2801340 RepID=A0A936YS80_9HYPH|nr:dihydrolipoyl dehydrogenase [Rhizobium setariae]MBL0373294.1 dihydrolipoyl dehydrogenase [Rhizobium setariae]
MSPTHDYDVLVIGGGPGGYSCAIRAAQLGLRTACVEERDKLGGTCLNVGCIPSKSLLDASHHFESASNGHLAAFGLRFDNVSFDLAAMMRQKDDVVASLAKGIDFLFKKHGVTRLKGTASFASPHAIDIEGKAVTARSIIIATGSSPSAIPGLDIDNESGPFVDSTGALALARVPEHMVVVGGGVIGLELGSVWRRLGSKVTVIELQDDILPGMDNDVRRVMAKLLKTQGLALRTATSVVDAVAGNAKAELTVRSSASQSTETLVADTVLVATGRKANTRSLKLENAGVVSDERGFIPVDSRGATGVAGIFAIGDVTRGPMLAHRAQDDGIALAERLAGGFRPTDHDLIASVIYTKPEAASVGRTEQELVASGHPYRKALVPMSSNSRAKVHRETDGFVKLLAEAGSGRIIGAHIVAGAAGTIIAQAVQAMEFSATAEDIAYTSHPHPGENEAIREAAFHLVGAPVHAA